MGENEHQSRYWSIDDIDQGNDVEEVLEPREDCCIYRVPQILRKVNEQAYTPRLISIGPLHYGRKELMGMEKQKRRYWSKFGESVNAQKLEEFKTYIENQEQHIRDHYAVSSMIESSKYVAMILHDAVFIIELFRRNISNSKDFLLEEPLNYHIVLDLLLLENQLPYIVLDHLYTKAFPSSEGYPSFFVLSRTFFGRGVKDFIYLPLLEAQQVKHFTNLLRCAIVMGVVGLQPRAVQSVRKPIYDVPNVTKLNESGLKFKGVKNKYLLDISLVRRKYVKWLPWYGSNELQIPYIKIYDETEGFFRNMMALEIFHYPTQRHICNYVELMYFLINTAKDVDLLVDKEIIANCVGDNELIAKMFNRLCSNISFPDSDYYDVVEKMKAHYKYPWNHLKATLKSVYFDNLWTGTATVVAAFLLIFTAIQTVCSVMQVMQVCNSRET